MGKKYNIILIDDEEKGLDALEALLQAFSDEFIITDRCKSVSEAKLAILKSQPDLIFLDIQMPEKDGMFLAKELSTLKNKIPYIFVTAHENYMQDAFKVQPFDYLLKPVSRYDFADTLLRFKNAYPKHMSINKIHILTNKGYEFITPDNIAFIDKKDRKSLIHFYDGNSSETYTSLKDLLEIISNDKFIKINKSVIVNTDYIKTFVPPDSVLVKLYDTVELSIGRSYIAKFKKHLKMK